MEESIDTSFKKIKPDFDNYSNRKAISYYTRALGHKHSLRGIDNDNQFKLPVVYDNEAVLTEPIVHEPIPLNSDAEITSLPTESKGVNTEDSEGLVNNIFRGRDFITSESWVFNEIIKSRIVSSDNDFVYLDCIIDIETMNIEHRQFHKSLFSNFKTLKTGDFALIKIKSKPGSFRVDVYSGKGIVNKELFDINDDIQELKGRDLGTKLREW